MPNTEDGQELAGGEKNLMGSTPIAASIQRIAVELGTRAKLAAVDITKEIWIQTSTDFSDQVKESLLGHPKWFDLQKGIEEIIQKAALEFQNIAKIGERAPDTTEVMASAGYMPDVAEDVHDISSLGISGLLNLLDQAQCEQQLQDQSQQRQQQQQQQQHLHQLPWHQLFGANGLPNVGPDFHSPSTDSSSQRIEGLYSPFDEELLPTRGSLSPGNSESLWANWSSVLRSPEQVQADQAGSMTSLLPGFTFQSPQSMSASCCGFSPMHLVSPSTCDNAHPVASYQQLCLQQQQQEQLQQNQQQNLSLIEKQLAWVDIGQPQYPRTESYKDLTHRKSAPESAQYQQTQAQLLLDNLEQIFGRSGGDACSQQRLHGGKPVNRSPFQAAWSSAVMSPAVIAPQKSRAPTPMLDVASSRNAGLALFTEIRSGKAWDELHPNVRDRVMAVVKRCDPSVKLQHFDAGVRHWLVLLTSQFGELAALNGLAAIESSSNLEGVRNMKAFITTRLIDHYENLIWSQDPEGYSCQHLTDEQYQLVHKVVHGGQGLSWSHFDPKVLETIRDLGSVEYTRTRLERLTARELQNVQNIPAYLYTLLSKRGKTARQAAAAKAVNDVAMASADGLSQEHGKLPILRHSPSAPPGSASFECAMQDADSMSTSKSGSYYRNKTGMSSMRALPWQHSVRKFHNGGTSGGDAKTSASKSTARSSSSSPKSSDSGESGKVDYQGGADGKGAPSRRVDRGPAVRWM